MKRSLLAGIMLVLTVFLGSTVLSVHTWSIVPQESDVSFSIKNFGLKVNGHFTGLEGAIKFDPTDLENSSLEASVEARTIDSGNNKRDNHLRSSDFFDVDHFPRISFKSSRITATEKGFLANGELTIKGKSQPLEIPFTFSEESGKGLFTGDFKVKRSEFGIGKPGATMGDKVTISLKVAAIPE
jgi:polyisoprenoid-binding protein YceI